MHARCLIAQTHQQVRTGGVGKSVSSVDLGELEVATLLSQADSAVHVYSHVCIHVHREVEYTHACITYRFTPTHLGGYGDSSFLQ